jgi:hypothetical protein
MKVARIYLRVSTDEQDLTRQAEIEHGTRSAGYYIAGVYREKASGARADRPELLRMIADLQRKFRSYVAAATRWSARMSSSPPRPPSAGLGPRSRTGDCGKTEMLSYGCLAEWSRSRIAAADRIFSRKLQ